MGNGEREGSLGRAGDLPARPAARPPAHLLPLLFPGPRQ